MRILYLSNLQDEGFAGLTYCVPAQIAAQSGFDDVHWYNFKPVERPSWREHSFYHNPNDYRFSIDLFRRRFWDPDLIVFEGFYAFHPNATLLSTLCSRIPYVIVPHCALTAGDQGKKTLKKKVCNALFYKRFARGAVAIQYLTKREMLESGDSWNDACFIQPNGIDPVDTANAPADKPGNPVRIVYVGRLEPYQKGLDILLDALRLLKEKGRLSGFTLSICGNSVNGFAEEIQSFIEREGLEEVVSVHPPVYDEEKRHVLETADVFLLTSRYEGMPMGLLEACAYGLPSIVTPGTNLAEEIGEENAGWVCDPAGEAIGEAIEAAASVRSDVYVEMSNGARNLASSFSWASIAESVHEDLSRLVAPR